MPLDMLDPPVEDDIDADFGISTEQLSKRPFRAATIPGSGCNILSVPTSQSPYLIQEGVVRAFGSERTRQVKLLGSLENTQTMGTTYTHVQVKLMENRYFWLLYRTRMASCNLLVVTRFFVDMGTVGKPSETALYQALSRVRSVSTKYPDWLRECIEGWRNKGLLLVPVS